MDIEIKTNYQADLHEGTHNLQCMHIILVHNSY
jgi:hypothetical protein